MKRLIIALLIALLIIIFAIINSTSTPINFILFKIELPLSLLFIVLLLLGAILAMFYSVPELKKKNETIEKQASRIKELENQHR
jgi:putative membrane protein